MPWTVTRQKQWPEGTLVVEISSGGPDYTNPGQLVAKYADEGETFNSPVDAVEAGIRIAQQWKADCPDKEIFIGKGGTGGMTMPFDPEELTEETFAAYREWAAETLEEMPKCDQCGGILPPKDQRFMLLDGQGEEFCSERCCEKHQEFEELVRIEDEAAEVVSELKLTDEDLLDFAHSKSLRDAYAELDEKDRHGWLMQELAKRWGDTLVNDLREEFEEE